MTQDSGKSCSSWLMPQKYKLNQYLNICSLFDQVGPGQGSGGPSSITARGSLVVEGGGRRASTTSYHCLSFPLLGNIFLTENKKKKDIQWKLLVSFNVSSLHRLWLTPAHKRENRKTPWLHLHLVRAESRIGECERVNDCLVINSVRWEMSWLRCAEVCDGSHWRTAGQKPRPVVSPDNQ